MTITLPYPPSVLSPNNRSCWQKKARYFKRYKADCTMMMLNARKALAGRDTFKLTFCPPDRHRRDIDNAISSGKAAIDALSAITGVDDSKFQLTFAWGDPIKSGAVIVEAA